MIQSINKILDDLQKFVNGKGREDNFCYSQIYSPSSGIKCVDFSPWIRKRMTENDLFALAVFQAQLGGAFSDEDDDSNSEINYQIINGELVEVEAEAEEEDDDDDVITFEMERIKKMVHFPFEKYFTGEIEKAKQDVIIAWFLNYPSEQYPRILSAYNLSLNDADYYLEKYNKRKNKQLELPENLSDTEKLNEFRQEMRKLPLATRLHVLDIFTYGKEFSKKITRPRVRSISEMTLYGTRQVGIDTEVSANILQQSKLIITVADGKGHCNIDFADTALMVLDYVEGMVPAYHQWWATVSSQMSDYERSYSHL